MGVMLAPTEAQSKRFVHVAVAGQRLLVLDARRGAVRGTCPLLVAGRRDAAADPNCIGLLPGEASPATGAFAARTD